MGSASSLDGACGIRDFVALMPVFRYTPYGLLATCLAKRLTLVDETSNLIPGPRAVIEFDAPASGIASPIFRNYPGFVGSGRTAGGAREFVIPNVNVQNLNNVTIRIVE
jgi:hypothetical protein